jgi:hypothetical protein
MNVFTKGRRTALLISYRIITSRKQMEELQRNSRIRIYETVRTCGLAELSYNYISARSMSVLPYQIQSLIYENKLSKYI